LWHKRPWVEDGLEAKKKKAEPGGREIDSSPGAKELASWAGEKVYNIVMRASHGGHGVFAGCSRLESILESIEKSVSGIEF
jgi:hypothetical protein